MLARLCRWTLPTLLVVVALAAVRMLVIQSPGPAIRLPRNEPAMIRPRFNDPRVVTDAQLAAVLERVKPPAGPANTNNMVHALRLWGPSVEFGAAGVPSGRELLTYFLDDAEFRRLAGADAPPLFSRGRDGMDVRSYDDQVAHRLTSSFHTDDLVATLAEAGVPLDTRLVLRAGEAQVRDLLATALSRFHLERHEYEWTAIAYARYVFPERGWRNKFGEAIDVDDLVHEILAHPPELGPCNGLHRLEALVVLLKADEPYRALRPRTRARILTALARASQALAAAQSPEGYWTRQWPRGAAARDAEKQPASTYDKLLVTGHHLEWLALAPEEVQPPRETIVRAGQWLARTLLEMNEKDIVEAYGPYTHAARALCLWRGMEAADAWKRKQG